MSQSQIILGIAGASGAGKSLFAQELYSRLTKTALEGDVQIVHEDSYYRDQSELDFEKRVLTNYDHPEAFEHALLVEHLNAFRSGQTIQVPKYDYAVHNRCEETETIGPCKVLIVEGILVLHDPAVRELFDFRVFVDVPLDICLVRRIRRDTKLRDRSVVSILDQFEKTVRPMYFQYVEPTKSQADVIVPRGGENEPALRMILDHVLSSC